MADAIRVRAFVADMPDMTPEQLASAYAWAKKKFERWGIQPRDGGYLLAALCSEEKSVRNWQSLMRTNMQHWKVDLPTTPQKGWLADAQPPRGVSIGRYIYNTRSDVTVIGMAIILPQALGYG